VRDLLRRWIGQVRWWWLTRQRVSAWEPGRSTLDRFRRLESELPTWEPTDTYRKLREIEDSSRSDLVVRLRIEG
jgi:hypothetical protein